MLAPHGSGPNNREAHTVGTESDEAQKQIVSGSMCLHGGRLATSEDLVIEDAELRSMLSTIAKRSAGGRH